MHTLDYANRLVVAHRTVWYFRETQKTFMVVRPCQKPTTTGRTSKFAIVMKKCFCSSLRGQGVCTDIANWDELFALGQFPA